jgi:hypothetical protein
MKDFITCAVRQILLVIKSRSTYKDGRNAYRTFMGNPGKKRALGRKR